MIKQALVLVENQLALEEERWQAEVAKDTAYMRVGGFYISAEEVEKSLSKAKVDAELAHFDEVMREAEVQVMKDKVQPRKLLQQWIAGDGLFGRQLRLARGARVDLRSRFCTQQQGPGKQVGRQSR